MALKAGWKVNPGAEVSMGWGGSHLIFLSIITCISRNLNELTDLKFLSQRVQILGQGECFLFALLDACHSVPLQGKKPVQSSWAVCLGIAHSVLRSLKATFPGCAEGDFQKAPRILHGTESLSFLCQFMSGFKSPDSAGGNTQSSVMTGVLSYWEQLKCCLRSFWKSYLPSINNCRWSNIFKNTTWKSQQHSTELHLNTCKPQSVCLTWKHKTIPGGL